MTVARFDAVAYVYGVTFSPFSISYLLYSVHIVFPSGDTGFANTGTHHVEESGRLLISSSYRWSNDEGPADSSYVSPRRRVLFVRARCAPSRTLLAVPGSVRAGDTVAVAASRCSADAVERVP